MNKQSVNVTIKDVQQSIGAYLQEINKTPEGENLADMMFYLFDTYDYKCDLEQGVINISLALAFFASPNISKPMCESMGETAHQDFCNMLANLCKIFIYIKDSEGCMTAMDLAFWNLSTLPGLWGQEILLRSKKEYDLKLQRLQDGEDFE